MAEALPWIIAGKMIWDGLLITLRRLEIIAKPRAYIDHDYFRAHELQQQQRDEHLDAAIAYLGKRLASMDVRFDRGNEELSVKLSKLQQALIEIQTIQRVRDAVDQDRDRR